MSPLATDAYEGGSDEWPFYPVYDDRLTVPLPVVGEVATYTVPDEVATMVGNYELMDGIFKWNQPAVATGSSADVVPDYIQISSSQDPTKSAGPSGSLVLGPNPVPGPPPGLQGDTGGILVPVGSDIGFSCLVDFRAQAVGPDWPSWSTSDTFWQSTVSGPCADGIGTWNGDGWNQRHQEGLLFSSQAAYNAFACSSPHPADSLTVSAFAEFVPGDTTTAESASYKMNIHLPYENDQIVASGPAEMYWFPFWNLTGIAGPSTSGYLFGEADNPLNFTATLSQSTSMTYSVGLQAQNPWEFAIPLSVSASTSVTTTVAQGFSQPVNVPAGSVEVLFFESSGVYSEHEEESYGPNGFMGLVDNDLVDKSSVTQVAPVARLFNGNGSFQLATVDAQTYVSNHTPQGTWEFGAPVG